MLEDPSLEAQGDVTTAAAKATSSVAQVITTNMQAMTRSCSSRNARAAEPESFEGSRDKAKQFVQSVHIAIMMQLNMFEDERMKSCMLSPSCGGDSTGLV